MTVEKKIITIGGGGFTHNQDNDQDKFILDHIIEVTEKTFDDFADSGSDEKGIKKILGLD